MPTAETLHLTSSVQARCSSLKLHQTQHHEATSVSSWQAQLGQMPGRSFWRPLTWSRLEISNRYPRRQTLPCAPCSSALVLHEASIRSLVTSTHAADPGLPPWA